MNLKKQIYLVSNKAIELPKKGIQALYFYLEKPGELLSDWITHLFLIELASDFIKLIPENLDLSIYNVIHKTAPYKFFSIGILPIFSTMIQRRLVNNLDKLLEYFNQPETDLIVRQNKVAFAWDLWGETLKILAEKHNINISLLINKKEDQSFLISKLLDEQSIQQLLNSSFSYAKKKKPLLRKFFFKSQNSSFFRFHMLGKKENNKQSENYIEKLYKKKVYNKKWEASQFITYKGKDNDLFIQGPPGPKNFNLHFKNIKNSPPIQGVIGNLICQIYGGLFGKKTSKNFLVIGGNPIFSHSTMQKQVDEKALLIQALAGETEIKIICDNANRYKSSLGLNSLRYVFDSLAIHTPCLFLIQQVDLIGERRPLLLGEHASSNNINLSSS